MAAWNAALPRPFDGFDWDLEGNDDAASPYNALSDATLAIAVNMSEAASAAGLVVTMVPAQSYFDETRARSIARCSTRTRTGTRNSRTTAMNG